MRVRLEAVPLVHVALEIGLVKDLIHRFHKLTNVRSHIKQRSMILRDCQKVEGARSTELMVKVGSGWTSFRVVAEKIAIECEGELIESAKSFFRRCPESAEEAESLINAEVESRINQQWADEITPFRGFERLPNEIRSYIWFYAFGFENRIRPFKYCCNKMWPTRHTVSPHGLLLSGRALAAEACRALYADHIFHFDHVIGIETC